MFENILIKNNPLFILSYDNLNNTFEEEINSNMSILKQINKIDKIHKINNNYKILLL